MKVPMLHFNPSHIKDFQKLLASQCDRRVDTHCPPRGDITGRKRRACPSRLGTNPCSDE
jgi:hypothetical protein